jgi:hypothetical protein
MKLSKTFIYSMENIFNSVYREDYLMGYSIGSNPYSEFEHKHYNEAFKSGFDLGRLDYEAMNGYISGGIPQLIVTKKILEDFLLAGMLGLDIDADGYNTYQLDIIEIWYQSGIEKYDPKQSMYLSAILEANGIEINYNSN